ncbi:Cof-type HAD-IIB family hydrolase [Candidatus Formimonas warabiya]|uniref:HAD family phosphatase n=1 Tax=Formimonas warabiya TaxID=1761012 RepID=A0A3G1KTY3_FORW1|nr:Cof-type HAD-IIB family hydrolase [Candidatus Formimonas warabiya]ATW25911.1 hypothetical protein DCMF_15020 [Candidatus Formimonas warabiya]
MNYKLIAVDLDDTLLDDRCRISPRSKDVIQQAQAKGVQVTLATGRMYRSALPFALDLHIDVPLITYQGSLVKTSVTKEILYHRTVPAELAKEVVALGEREDLSINVYLDDDLYVHKITSEVRTYCRLARVPYQEVGNLSSILDRDPTKLLFIGAAEKLDHLWIKVKKIFGDRLYITKSKPQYLEFTHPQGTKGHGLSAVARHLGVQKEEIIAFGDSFNDLELFRNAGFAVAMANARDEIKKEAHYVTGSNNEEGVARAIEKFVLCS